MKARHTLCDGCNTFPCDTSTGKIHEQVLCPSTFWDPYQGNVTIETCGKKYWACGSDSGKHRSITLCQGCEQYYRGCVASNHEWIYEICPSQHGHYECDDEDHSFYERCSMRDTNEELCTMRNFYGCDKHSHIYPSSGNGSGSGSGSTSENTPTPTPSPSTPVDNTPDCSDCIDGCSSCQATCANGHTYDPRRTGQVNGHRTRTCQFSNCGQTWLACGPGAPICNKPYRRQNGMSCQASD